MYAIEINNRITSMAQISHSKTLKDRAHESCGSVSDLRTDELWGLECVFWNQIILFSGFTNRSFLKITIYFLNKNDICLRGTKWYIYIVNIACSFSRILCAVFHGSIWILELSFPCFRNCHFLTRIVLNLYIVLAIYKRFNTANSSKP